MLSTVASNFVSLYLPLLFSLLLLQLLSPPPLLLLLQSFLLRNVSALLTAVVTAIDRHDCLLMIQVACGIVRAGSNVDDLIEIKFKGIEPLSPAPNMMLTSAEFRLSQSQPHIPCVTTAASTPCPSGRFVTLFLHGAPCGSLQCTETFHHPTMRAMRLDYLSVTPTAYNPLPHRRCEFVFHAQIISTNICINITTTNITTFTTSNPR